MIDADRRARRERVLIEHMESENVQEWDRTMTTFSHPRYELVPTGEVYDGEQAVHDYWVDGRSVITDQRNELIDLQHTDRGIMIEFWLRGTHLGGPNPTGRRFKCRMCAIFDFDDDDRMTLERVYWDRTTIARQLQGVDPVDDEPGR